MKKCLSSLIKRAGRTRFYQSLWRGVENISTCQFEKIPFSEKSLFNSKNINDSLAVSKNYLSYCYFSSGTTGNPKMILFTNKEWIERSTYRKNLYKFIGLNKDNKVIILLPFGPWIAGPSAQEALLQLGCTVFPVGDLNSKEEINGIFSMIKRHSIDTVITFPSFLQNFITYYHSQKNKIFLKNIITSGEYVSDRLRSETEKIFGVKIYSSYATSESFIGIECTALNGFHYDPEKVLVEIIDPDKYEPTDRAGLVVITVLFSKAVPIIRYVLDDICFIQQSQCSCGSYLPRIIWTGRIQETFVVAGAVNVYSYQIHDVLSKSNISINRCVIKIFNNKISQDILIFNLYTTTESGMWPIEIKNNLIFLISNMSMDFKDVILCNFVKIKVNLQRDKNVSKSIKKRKILIYDKREHAR